MNMTNMKNVITRLVFPLVVGGMVWFGGSATAQDIINITASHSGETIRGANTTIDINFTMQGRFALTNSDGGTFLQYPTLGVLLDSPDNNHIPNANADWSSFSTYSTPSGYKTVITFRYTVQAGDMAAPLRLVGYSAYDSNQAYYLTWNGWQVRNLDTGSNAVWQVNYLFAESGFGLSSSQLNLAAQKVTIKTLDFDDNSSPATVAATDSTLWHVTASAATPAAVSLVAFAVDTNIVQIGNVPGQQKYDFNLPQGSTSTAFLVKGLIAGSTDIYVMRSTTYNSITNFSLPSSFTNFIKRAITVSAPPAPRVSVIMSTSGTESISLNEGTYQTFIVQLSEARTNDVMVDVASSSSCVMFGITNYTSTVSVRVPANSTSSAPVRFNALDGNAYVELTPTVTSSAIDVTYFADRRSGYVTVANVNPSVTARLASSTYATRGKACLFSWTATDVAADTNSGMTVSWDFGDGTITNVTGAAGVISHMFTTTSSGRTVVVTAYDKDGGASSYSFTVEVRDPEPQPTVRVVSSPTLCSETNGTGELMVTLSQSYPGDVYVRLTPSIDGQSQNCLLFGTNTTKVVRIIQGDTNSAAVVYTIVDGTDLTYDPGVDITPAVTNAGPDAYYTSLYPLTLRIKNEAPIVTTPTSRDDTLGPAPAYTNVYLGRSFSFPYAVSDVAADQSSLVLTWDFGDASGNVVVTGYQGSVSHTYTSVGIKYVQMQAVDKDGAKSVLVRFPISVILPPPDPTVRVLSPSAIVPESISYNNDYSIIVQLSESFTNEVAVGLTVTPPNSLANGTLLLSTNRVVFKKGDSLEKTVYIHALDGTVISLSGFTITPTVLPETPDAKVYYQILDPGSVQVANVNPTIVTPSSTAGTTNIAFVVAQGVPWPFRWQVTDVAQDLLSTPLASAMTITWDFGDGGVLVTYGGSGTNAIHTYTSSGSKTVTMTATDKDGGSSYVQFSVLVKESKELLVVPVGPSTTSGYPSSGYGTITSPEARSVSMIGPTYDFLYNPDTIRIKVIATPYTSSDGYDSFFYTWIGDTSLGFLAQDLSPYTSAALYPTNGGIGGEPVVALLALPDLSTDSTTASSKIWAIFSREKYATDNMGDINLDGIPDKFAFDIEKVASLTNGTSFPGTTDLSTFNEDLDKIGGTPIGDYLPANPDGVGGVFDFRAVNTGTNAFTALLEVRGWDPDLHRVIGGVKVSDDTATAYDEPYTDPTLADTDGDGFPDGWEYYFWYDAAINHKTGSRFNPYDSGQGSVIPSKEIQLAFEPSQTRADLDQLGTTAKADAGRDFDNDGLLDREELTLGTNPINWDTDGDGICDSWEILRRTNPNKNDNASNPDGDFMAYATVARYFLTVVEGGTTTNTYLVSAGTALGDFTGTVSTWYHYGSDTDPIAEGYPLNLSGVKVIDSVATNVVIMHYQVLREFGFDPRTAWTSALNNEQHPTRWPAWLADIDDTHTKPFTTRDEYLLAKFMSANRINGAPASMGASALLAYSTDPLTPDSDATTDHQDGMPDGWELYVSIDPSTDLTIPANRTMTISPWNALDGDLDMDLLTTALSSHDGLINRREFAGTDSSAAYTNSALYISTNVFAAGTVTIKRPASDANWINKFWPTNPWAQDTDGDGIDDLAEMTFVYGTPVDNGTSCIQGGGLNPDSVDTDLDALPDAWEFEFKGTEPSNSVTYTTMAITNGMDGTFADAYQDWDHDGLLNYQEYWVQAVRGFRYDIPDVGANNSISKNVGVPMDSNSDPYYLFTEVSNAWDRAQWPFGDPGISAELYILLPPAGHVYNVTSKLNLYATTDPRLPDTDGDGMDDYYEMFHGLNPILGDLLENAAGKAVDLSKDRIAKAYFSQSGSPIVIGSILSYFYNDWDQGVNLDFTTRPWMTGLPEVDPDADGLLNLEERLLPNTSAPSYSNTDPTPIWLTDNSNTNSVTSRFYTPGAGSMFFWPPVPEVPPAYLYDYEMNEGYDTDNDGISDKAELIGTQNSLSDPQDHDDPYRRQAIWFSGTNSAASSYQGFAYNIWSLRSFTVELWARPEVVTNVEQVLVERVLAFQPSDLSNVGTTVVRRNFRIGIASDGRVYGMFQNTGSHDETTSEVYAYGSRLTTNKWVHIAIRMDGVNSLFTLLVNGQVASAVATDLIPATGTLVIESDSGTPDTSATYTVLSGTMVLGAANDNPLSLKAQSWNDYSHFYRGSIDEVRIWDGARSDAQIRTNYTKRFVRDDELNNRLTVRTEELSGYSRVWSNPLRLEPELLFHYTFDNLFSADSTNAVATAPRGFEAAAVATNRPSDAAVAWWAGMETKSTVYTDYNYLPWIENSIEHLPVYNDTTSVVSNGNGVTVILTNGVADSVYWSYMKAGATSGTFLFPNSNNPYGFCYGSTGVSSDLLPLGDAFAKLTAEMWDNMGASSSWTDTSVDSDSDGLPDWWELYISGTTTGAEWDEVNPGSMLTYGQQYQRDVAMGMTANNNPYTNPSGWVTLDKNGDGIPDSSTPTDSNPVVKQTADSDHDGMPDWWEIMFGLDPNDATGINGADGDPDEDGLSNYYEYLAGTNPFSRDSDANGTADIDEDADGDGLSNGEEFIYKTNLASVDTDDDGIDDLTEIQRGLDPLDPIMPYVQRSLVNDGSGYVSIPKSPLVQGADVDSDGLRFNLSDWTLSAQVKLTAVPTSDVLLIQRQVQSGTNVLVNYELGITKGSCLPYVRFHTALGMECKVTGYKPIETNVWTQVGGRFGTSNSNRVLSVIQDYTTIARQVSGLYCVTNSQSGDLIIAKNLIGEIDEVQIWNEARSDAEIETLRNKTLLFGKIGQEYSFTNNGVTTNVMVDVSARDMLLYYGKVALYLPFDDGRHVETNATLDAAFKQNAVDDFVHFADGWQISRPYAGSLVGGIDFSPLTNNPTPVFPLEPGSRAAQDSDGDGMPDAFEVYYGLDPDNDGSTGTYELGPDGDLDGDGLNNLYEYYSGTDPWFYDSNENGVSDADEDSDGDGVSNINEYKLGSHPSRTDTDDDGIADGTEVQNGTNPAFSDSPSGILRSMVLDGKTHQIPSPSVNPKRFNSSAWTVEAWVRPGTTSQTGSLIRYAGKVYTNGIAADVVFYELGLNNGIPYIRMDTTALQPVVCQVSGRVLPAAEWTHLAGVFDPDNKALTLYVNGVSMASKQVLMSGLAGSETAKLFPGKAYIGSADGVIGNIDEVRIWKTALSQAEVVNGIQHLVAAGNKKLICYFRFDDGGLTAEDFAYPIRPPRTFDSSLVAWTGSLDTPMLYCMSGIVFDASTAYMGTRSESDDSDGDQLPDWWEEQTASLTVTVPITTIVYTLATNTTTTVNNGVTNTTTVVKRTDVDLYVSDQRTEVISPSSERASSVVNLGWEVAYGTVTAIPEYIRTSDGTTQGRWCQTPDAAWLFKDVYLTADDVATAEMRFLFHNIGSNSVVCINGTLLSVADLETKRVSTLQVAETATYKDELWEFFSEYFLDADFLLQGRYLKAGWNRIAVRQINEDLNLVDSRRYEQFWLTLVANAGQTTLIGQNDRWWIYGHPGSMVEPPVDAAGRHWYEADYGLDTYADPDGDGLSNYYEMMIGTNPDAADTDGNGVLDGYEDADNDGVQNLQELKLGTDPLLPDTDDDGVPDLADGYAGAVGSWATNALLPKIDRCLKLSGDGYLAAPLLSRWSSGTNSFTLLMSVKPFVFPVSATNILAEREVYSGVYNYAITLLPSGKVRALVTVDTGSGTSTEIAVVSSSALVLNTWADLSLVADLGTQTLTLRVNGTQSGMVTSGDLVQLPATTGNGVVQTRFGVGFSGQIDNIAFYNTAVSESNLMLVRTEGVLAYQTDKLQACYLFDDGTSSNGVSGVSTWTTGQVQDFGCMFWSKDEQLLSGFTLSDWTTGWRNGGTLVGTGTSIANVKSDAELAVQDQDGDGIPDWWEIKYGLNPYSDEGENGASGDPDGDGLSNYAEYLISEVYQFYPGLNPRLFSTSGTVSDYFLKQGSLYFGEMFTDHDFMEDSLESETARYIYDANADDDEDGWSNWAETRYSVAAALATGTNAVPAMMALDSTQYPIPTIEATFRYNGNQQGGAIVVQTYSAPDMNGQPDAVFSVTNASAWPLVATLKEANSGYVLEGTNYVFAFLDLDNSGTWNAGEPCGVATPFATRIGWDYNRLSVQLTDYTPGYLRLSLTTGQRSEDVVAGSAAASGSSSSSSASVQEVRVRVLRSSADSYTTYQRIVLDKVIKSPRAELHEGDLMGQGDLGLDWGLIGVPVTQNREILVYDVYAGGQEVLTSNTRVTTFTNRFDVADTRGVATNTSPISGKYVYSARPTFKWIMPDGYTAFAIEIRKGSSSGTLIYQSGALQDPARDQITGEYVWDAPIYAGDRLPNGQVFASDTLYAWRVIALNSKFTLTTAPITWSSWNYFRLDVDAPPSSSGYGDLRASVKYFGPATHYLSGRVRVQAYRTASFSGVPDAEYTLSDAELGLLTNAVDSGTNAVVRGLLPSSMVSNYYVMAFIDLNTNGVRDAWESWGYANEYGENSSTPYSPKPFDVKVSTLPNVANIVIEDADTDQDWFPDAWEYEQYPGDPNFLGKTGPSSTWVNGDTEVNPFLVTNGTQTVAQLLSSASLGLSAALTGTTDADGDGISDMVELLLGSNPNSASSANDGYTDSSKYSIGLSPSDSLTFKVTSIKVNGSTLDLDWDVNVTKSSVSGGALLSTSSSVTYVVEYTASLSDANWQTAGTGAITLKSGSQAFTSQVQTDNENLSAEGFFRVRLVR